MNLLLTNVSSGFLHVRSTAEAKEWCGDCHITEEWLRVPLLAKDTVASKGAQALPLLGLLLKLLILHRNFNFAPTIGLHGSRTTSLAANRHHGWAA